jgi:hypothetical protein
LFFHRDFLISFLIGAVVSFAVIFAFKLGYDRGGAAGRLEGAHEAYSTQSIDAIMYYTNCLDEPDVCLPFQKASDHFRAKAKKHQQDLKTKGYIE